MQINSNDLRTVRNNRKGMGTMRRKASRTEYALSTCKYTRAHRAPWKRALSATPAISFKSKSSRTQTMWLSEMHTILQCDTEMNGARMVRCKIVLLHIRYEMWIGAIVTPSLFLSVSTVFLLVYSISNGHTFRMNSKMHLLFDISIYMRFSLFLFFLFAVANFTRLCISLLNLNALIHTTNPHRKEIYWNILFAAIFSATPFLSRLSCDGSFQRRTYVTSTTLRWVMTLCS